MSREGEIAELERSERVMAEVAAAVRERVGTDDSAYRGALDALERRIAEQLGVEWDAPSVSEDCGEAVEAALDAVDGELDGGLDAALAEPHALGWFHQYFGEPAREASHRAHHEREEKHATAGVTTQLYTPRWIADALARSAIEPEGEPAPTVFDPAVGGGQMLLAAYDVLRSALPDAPPTAIVQRLGGRDIDARAVDVARRTLKWRVARDAGDRVAAAEEVVDEQVRPGDGLFESDGSAQIVLTNPPYMGLRSMPEELKERVRDAFEPFHRDLYAAFIRRCHELAESRVGILAQQTIWYLKSFRKARERLLERGDLEVFLHLGPHAFASLGGEKANVAAFVQRAFGAEGERDGEAATFLDLRDLQDRRAMRDAVARQVGSGASESDRRLEAVPEDFSVIPGQPVAYWLPEPLRRQFDGGRRLGDVAEVPGCQNKTGANRDYLRSWNEVEPSALWRRPLGVEVEEAPEWLEPPSEARWMFYSKGGGYAPWWGNWQTVVDWSEEAREFYGENSTSNLLPERYRFRQGICYTDFGGQTFNARWMPPGCLFDMAGPAIFSVDGRGPSFLFALLAVLNTTPVRMLLNAMNPSIHYQVTDLRRLPLPEWSDATGDRLAELAAANVRDVRRLAADLEESPVAPGDAGTSEERAVGPAELYTRCREREDEIERIVFELYGLEKSALDRIGATHRYAPADG